MISKHAFFLRACAFSHCIIAKVDQSRPPTQAFPFSTERTTELSTGVRNDSPPNKCLSRFLWQCEDSKVDALTEALQATVMRWKCKFPAPLPLELYTSSNFIGLFVKEESAEVLKKFAADFAAEAASKAGEWLCWQLQRAHGLVKAWAFSETKVLMAWRNEAQEAKTWFLKVAWRLRDHEEHPNGCFGFQCFFSWKITSHLVSSVIFWKGSWHLVVP